MVLSGLGIGVLPEMSVKKELELGEIMALPYETPYEIYTELIYHKDKWLSQNLQEFIQFIAEKNNAL